MWNSSDVVSDEPFVNFEEVFKLCGSDKILFNLSHAFTSIRYFVPILNIIKHYEIIIPTELVTWTGAIILFAETRLESYASFSVIFWWWIRHATVNNHLFFFSWKNDIFSYHLEKQRKLFRKQINTRVTIVVVESC
jgi:hypothetical protein